MARPVFSFAKSADPILPRAYTSAVDQPLMPLPYLLTLVLTPMSSSLVSFSSFDFSFLLSFQQKFLKYLLCAKNSVLLSVLPRIFLVAGVGVCWRGSGKSPTN